MLQLDLNQNKDLIQNWGSSGCTTKFESSCVAYLEQYHLTRDGLVEK